MPYARPLIPSPKRHLVTSPGHFRDLEGQTLPHKRDGSWKIGPLYVIRDKRFKSGHSRWANMMYVATCTRCEKTQHIEARSLKNGTGCKYCREADEREKEAQRNINKRLQAKHKARQAADQKAIDDKLPALICSGLSAKQIANALKVRHGVVVHRLRELGLRTAHPKRSKGQVFTAGGRLATTEIQKKAVLEERRHNQRVASRLARGVPPHLAHTEGKLKSGAKGHRLSPEERARRKRERKRRQRAAIKADPVRLQAQRLAARRYQCLKKGLDPDAPIMGRGRRPLKGLR